MATEPVKLGTWDPAPTMTFDHRYSSMDQNNQKVPATLWGVQNGKYVYVSNSDHPLAGNTKVLWLVDPNTGKATEGGRNFTTNGRGIADVFGNDPGSVPQGFAGQPSYGAPRYGTGDATASAKSVADTNYSVPQSSTLSNTQQTQNVLGASTQGQVIPTAQQTTVAPPSGNLQPGMSGDAVKQLQDYLVSKGLMTQEQVKTGYGTYGPQTTAAVTQLQKSLGVQTGGYDGYYGPQTMQAIQSSPSFNQGNPTTATGGTGLDQSALDGLKLLTGWSDDQIQQYAAQNPAEAAQWAMTGEYLKKQQDLYGAQQDITAAAIADAYTKASNDPLIAQKYKEIADFDKQWFQQNLQAVTQVADQNAIQTQAQFEADRKALAEQQGAAGTAYSGFRGQAQERLAQGEAGVVESSRRTLKKTLDDMTSQFEQKYGTSATTPATAQFVDPRSSSGVSLSGLKQTPTTTSTGLTGSTIGGIQGTIQGQKAQDVITRQQQIAQGLIPAQVPTT